jgi:hypothetical protein
MKMYCKAYALGDLRRYPDWSAGADPAEKQMKDDDFVYLCDDFTVVTNPIEEGDALFSEITSKWKDFCSTEMNFSIPEDLTFAYTEAEKS